MLVGWRLVVTKLFIIPQRWVLSIMGFLAVVNAYTLRVVLSLAITEMIQPSHNAKNETFDHHACPVSPHLKATPNVIEDPNDLFDWTDSQQGLILSAFYWGYVAGHIPLGVLVQRFGGKHCLGFGILSTAIFTILTPFVARTGSWEAMVVLRILVGVGESTTYPALNMMLARWIPLGERSKSGSLVFAGSLLGTIISNSVSGMLIASTKSWASVFYFFGGIGVIWFLVWCLLCYSEPDSHPFISEEEKRYLKQEITNVSEEHKNVPWRPILTSIPLWALIIAQIGHDWGFFAMVTDLPKYMKDVLRFDVKSNGFLSSIPYAVMLLVSLMAGVLCDWLIHKQYMSVTFSRKFFTIIAAVGPAVFIVLASYCGCDKTLAIICLTVAMAFMGTFICGMKVNSLDLSPNFAGTLMSLVNGIGALSGALVPYLIGALTADHTLEEWRLIFWITFAVLVVTGIIYVMFASGEEQWWNEPNSRLTTNIRMYTVEECDQGNKV